MRNYMKLTKRVALTTILIICASTLLVSCASIQQLVTNVKAIYIKRILVDQKPPITNTITDAITESPFLDDFDPDATFSMELLQRTDKGGFILKNSGTYFFEAQSFCLHAGAYAPGYGRGGDGYIHAPLKGPHADIVRNVLERSVEHPEIPQSLIQGLLWAIIARTKINELSPVYYPVALTLLTPDEILELSGGALGLIPERLLDRALAKLPPHVSRIFEVEAELRTMLTSAAATYEAIERLAVLAGDPPFIEGDKEVPAGRWSYHPNGFWVRYFPHGYSRTRIEVHVPKRIEIERDHLERIIRMSDQHGNGLYIRYDDSLPPAEYSDDPEVRGYAFSSVRSVNTVFLAPEAIANIDRIWDNQGYTLLGIPSGNGVAVLTDERYEELQSAYNRASVYKRQLNNLAAYISIDSVFRDLIDLAHLRIALEKVLSAIQEDEEKWIVTDVNDLINEGWQYTINNREGNYNVEEGLEFDPAEGLAQPGKQGRQRLAQSARPADKQEEYPTVSIRGVRPLLLYRETETFGSPILTLEGVGDPPGGTYTWSVVAGAEKIQLEGNVNHHSLPIRPVARSDPPGGDVVLQLTYTTSDGTATARVSLSVHTPSTAIQIATNTTRFNGPVKYGYDFTVRYRILDQFGERFPEGDLFLDEDLVVLMNPYNTTFEEREYMSDSNAEYEDHYTLIFHDQPIPNDFLARVRQVVRAQGVEVLDHILVWKSTHVEFE